MKISLRLCGNIRVFSYIRRKNCICKKKLIWLYYEICPYTRDLFPPNTFSSIISNSRKLRDQYRLRLLICVFLQRNDIVYVQIA